jgi:hypothetical protein
MSQEIEMKQKVLGMLKDFLMGQEGGKFKPKQVGQGEPEAPEAPEEEIDEEEPEKESLVETPSDEEDEDGKSKVGLKAFLSSIRH